MSRLAPSSRLGFSAPVATRLLPSPAGLSAAGASAPHQNSVDAMAALSARAAGAGREAIRFAERAVAAARERRPEAEQRARQAAAAAGGHAVRLADRAAALADSAAAHARVRLADPAGRVAFLRAHRRRLAQGAAALVAATLVALAAGSLGGGAAARAAVEAAIDDYGLRPVLRYRDASSSLFGAVTLSGVAVEIGGLTVTADALRVERIEMSGGAVRSLRLAADRARLPLLEAARRTGGPALRAAAGLGYTALLADLTLDVSFDDQARVALVELSGTGDALGSFSARASLGGLTSGAVADALRPSARQRSAPPAVIASATLRDATLRLDDAELRRRMEEITDRAVPDHPDAAPAAGPPLPEPAQEMEAAVPAGDRAVAARTLRRWVEHGGSLTLTLSPVAPLPLFRPDPLGSVTPTFVEPGFLASAQMRVSE